MNYKNRLFLSIALSVVCSAIAHGQASSTSAGLASINITGIYSVATGGETGGVYVFQSGYYSYQFGSYVIGAGSAYDAQNYGLSGGYSFVAAGGSAYAGLAGYSFASDGGTIDTQITVMNSNSFGVDIYFTGATDSYVHAAVLNDASFAYGFAYSSLIFDGSYSFQYSASFVRAYFGFPDPTNLGYFGFAEGQVAYYFNAYNSGPFAGGTYLDLTYSWLQYIAPNSSVTFDERVQENHIALSQNLPGPAAVAPFAIGLLAAVRRRKKA